MDIYKITAKDYYYYGQTINTAKMRWRGHSSSLKHNKHGNAALQNIYNKHGKEVFSYEVLFSCDDKELLDLVEEEFIIKHYDDALCLNICRKANAPGSVKGRSKPLAWRKKMSGGNNGRAKAVELNGVVYPTIKAAADANNLSSINVCRWLKGSRTAPKNIMVSYHKEIK
jgi:hypothetical protein